MQFPLASISCPLGHVLTVVGVTVVDVVGATVVGASVVDVVGATVVGGTVVGPTVTLVSVGSSTVVVVGSSTTIGANEIVDSTTLSGVPVMLTPPM